VVDVLLWKKWPSNISERDILRGLDEEKEEFKKLDLEIKKECSPGPGQLESSG